MADGLIIMENLIPITKENAGNRESGSQSRLPSNWGSSIPILGTNFFFFFGGSAGWGGLSILGTKIHEKAKFLKKLSNE